MGVVHFCRADTVVEPFDDLSRHYHSSLVTNTSNSRGPLWPPVVVPRQPFDKYWQRLCVTASSRVIPAYNPGADSSLWRHNSEDPPAVRATQWSAERLLHRYRISLRPVSRILERQWNANPIAPN